MRVLLDASLDADTLRRIRAILEQDPVVTEVQWVTGRNAGRYRFVETGLALRATQLGQAQAAVRRIEAAVRAAVPHIERVLVQVEPARTPTLRYAVPLAAVDGPVSAHFGEAAYFAILTVQREDHALVERRVIANPHAAVERGKGLRVAEWLVAQKVDVVLAREDLQGKGPAYVLRDAGVELRVTDAEDPQAAVGSP
jgi:predicted Fe-Mo cluster-binding NifX family protein